MPGNSSKNNKRGTHGKGNSGTKPKPTNQKNIRSKKIAKQSVKKIVKDNGIPFTWEEKRLLKQKAMVDIKKERQKQLKQKIYRNIASVEIRTPMKSGNYSYQWDKQCAVLIIHSLAEYLSMKYPLFLKANGIAPWEFKAYCLTCILCYLNVVGKLDGNLSKYLPTITPAMMLPRSLAKYMQYLAPYESNGIEQITEFIYEDDFTFMYDFIGKEDGMQFGPVATSGTNPGFPYTGFPMNLTLSQFTVTQPASNNPNVPVGADFFQRNALTTPATLSGWMSTQGNISRVANALQTHGLNVIPFMSMPGVSKKRAYAPDGSAYCVKAGQLIPEITSTAISADGGILNVHENWDVETSIMFCAYRANQTTPTVIIRPIPTCTYDYNKQYQGVQVMPWWCQIFYVYHHLMDNCDAFHWGRIKDHTISGAYLRTLFPNPRNVTAFSFYTLIAHAYRYIQTMQSQAIKTNGVVGVSGAGNPVMGQGGNYANETKNMTNWALFCALPAMALLRRFNEQQVVPANCPLVSNSGVPAMMQQSMYIGSAALTNALPALVAMAIDHLGCVIKSGVLLVPVTQFSQGGGGQPFPLNQGQLVGPIAWSAYGWNSSWAQTYKYASLQTTPIGPLPQAPTVPAAIELNYLKLDANFAAAYCGYDETTGRLWPRYLGGNFIQQFRELSDAFVFQGNLTNDSLKCFIPPANPKLGCFASMTSEVVLDFASLQLTNLLPNGLQLPSLPQAIQASLLAIARMDQTSITSTNPLPPADSVASLIISWCSPLNQASSQSDDNLSAENLFTMSIFTGSPLPTVTQPQPQGGYNATTYAGSSLVGITSKLTHAVMNPDSEFANAKKLVDHAYQSIGSVVPVSSLAKIKKISTLPALKAQITKIEGSVFGNASWTSNITARSLGRLGKGVPDNVASNLAIINANSDVTASDNEISASTNTTPKLMMCKLDGHRLKKVANACGSVAKSAASGIDAAAKAAAGVASSAASIGNSIAGIASLC